MTAPTFLSIDMRFLPGRLLAAGDIHGRFDLLRDRLGDMGFDRRRDRLVLLGDLVDRGPYSDQADQWWNEIRVVGNHEQMTLNAAFGMYKKQHMKHGGMWLERMSPSRQIEFARRLVDAPIAIEALTPGGRRVGFVHAQVPVLPRHDWIGMSNILDDPTHPEHAATLKIALSARYDWAKARVAIENHNHADHRDACSQAVWTRTQVNLMRDGHDVRGVDGIDHVFYGHTIFEEPTTHRNCSWIDTGAYQSDVLTVVDVDAWVEAAEQEGKELVEQA